VIVLAAGQGFRLDGFHKLRIKDPRTGKTLLEHLRALFAAHELTVVLGYQAISVMNEAPDVDYIYNEHWSITGNSYSLSLALDERPCIVVSGDLFFDRALVTLVEDSPKDAVFVQRSENKQAHSVRCSAEGGRVTDLYLGEPRKSDDTETIGIYKVSDASLLRSWKRACAQNRSVFCGINLPIADAPVAVVDKGDAFLHEVNTHLDYLNLIKRVRNDRS
jgi:choline kinase